MEKELLEQLAARGARPCIVSIRRLEDLRQAIEGQYRQGLLDEQFYQTRLAWYTYSPPDDMPEAQSLLVVAYPDPPVRFTFYWRGQAVEADVPPSYLHWKEKDLQAGELLAGVLAQHGHRLTRVFVPKKLLAVCSGLALYGRNNITYVQGMGSYHRLAAFCSDLPCEDDDWQGPRMMDPCERCTACRRACPTGAIGHDRFLLHAERCLTYLNELPGDVPFPDWLEPSYHNCLVGCMLCQAACPENRGLLDWHEPGHEFTEEETALLLEGLTLQVLPAALRVKAEHWDPEQWYDGLPRNLRAVLLAGHSHPPRGCQ
jgi:epoxyqueuosine reductase